MHSKAHLFRGATPSRRANLLWSATGTEKTTTTRRRAHLLRSARGTELEEFAVRPDVGRLATDIDGHVPDEVDALAICVRLHDALKRVRTDSRRVRGLAAAGEPPGRTCARGMQADCETIDSRSVRPLTGAA